MIDLTIPEPPAWFTDALALERQKAAARAAVAELPRLEAELDVMDGTTIDFTPDGRTEVEVRAEIDDLKALLD